VLPKGICSAGQQGKIKNGYFSLEDKGDGVSSVAQPGWVDNGGNSPVGPVVAGWTKSLVFSTTLPFK
jgi:hypothetical protein